MNYRLYGLTLRSSLSLPCPRAGSKPPPDVWLVRGTKTRFARARREAQQRSGSHDWFHCCKLAGATTYIRWTGLFEFLVSPDGRRIEYRRLEHATPESFTVYLLGQVLSFSLVTLGAEPLHGTAVAVGGKAVAFVGDCGYGKSTLGAAMLARGFPLIADDLIALKECDGVWMSHVGIPRLKLFPSVARSLLGIAAGAARMNDGTSKLVLPLRPTQTSSPVAPLKAIYVLSAPEPHADGTPLRIRIDHLSGREAFLEIIRAAFNLIVLDRSRLQNQFRFAERLAATVPVRRLTHPRDLAALPAVCDALIADLAETGNAR
jgi:hypothetical protein